MSNEELEYIGIKKKFAVLSLWENFPSLFI